MNQLAAGHAYFDIGAMEISPDARLLAYCEDDVGRREYTLRVKDLENGTMLATRIHKVENDIAWMNDGRSLLYIAKDPVTLLGKYVRRHRLGTDPRVTLYGQDIEDPKGDVFGLTRGLSTEFPGRVNNSPLTESTITGVSVGRALAGGRPVACIQFADFVPLAFNQLASELGSLYWRSNGGWPVPVVVMMPCGGYRPGLGPFHAQTFESVLAHVPGLDVVMPSTAGDAVGLLNAAFEGGRPTVFLYPKVCLNDAALATSADVERQIVRPGVARRVMAGGNLTLVTWGGTVPLCVRVAENYDENARSVFGKTKAAPVLVNQR